LIAIRLQEQSHQLEVGQTDPSFALPAVYIKHFGQFIGSNSKDTTTDMKLLCSVLILASIMAANVGLPGYLKSFGK